MLFVPTPPSAPKPTTPTPTTTTTTTTTTSLQPQTQAPQPQPQPQPLTPAPAPPSSSLLSSSSSSLLRQQPQAQAQAPQGPMPSCIVVSDEPTRRVSHQRQHHTHRLSTAFPAAPALLAPPSPSPSVSAIDVEECIGGGPLDYGAGIMGGGGIPGDIGDLPPPPPPPPPDSIPTGDYCAIFRVYYHDKPPCLRCRKFLVSDYAKFVLIHPIPSTRDTELCDSIIPTDYLTQLKDTVTQNSTAIRHLKQGQPASVAARLPEPPIVTHPIGYCSVFETEYSLESPPCLAQKFPTEKYPGFTQVNLHQKVTREEVESLKKHLQFAISQNSVILQALAEEERKLDDQLAEYNLCPVPVDSATTKL